MVYKIRIQQFDGRGSPDGQAALYEAKSRMEAIALAAYEVDIGRSTCQRWATVLDPSGHVVFAYIGRRVMVAGDEGQ